MLITNCSFEAGGEQSVKIQHQRQVTHCSSAADNSRVLGDITNCTILLFILVMKPVGTTSFMVVICHEPVGYCIYCFFFFGVGMHAREKFPSKSLVISFHHMARVMTN